MSITHGRDRGHRLFAAVYDRIVEPLEREVLGERRARLLAGLEGRILDVGAGTGANLPHFDRGARVVALEPDPAMRKRLAAKLAGAPVPVELVAADAESLPFPDASFDAVVCTCVLCTVADLDRALAEARRVLKPEGRLIVLEHVRGTGRLARMQDRVTPLWSRLIAGCHPNRDTRAAIARAGFGVEPITTFDPFPRWNLARPMIEGVVQPVDVSRSASGSQRPSLPSAPVTGF
jgi:ubiquinone/menaquinone biosynthesis C-methylase UbiE